MGKGMFIAAAVVTAITAGALAWQFWPVQEESHAQQHDTAASTAAPALIAHPRTATWPPPFPERSEERTYVPLLPTGPQLSAAQSLAGTREGDSRTPPIVRSQSTQVPPSAAELDDPKAYQQYEARQNAHLYAAYIQAADQEIPRLRAAIQRARDIGMTPEEIAIGEEKLRRITAMQEQLLKEHPELQNDATKPGLK